MHFDNYDALERISSGGNATVYKGRHRFLDRYAAIKVYDKKKLSDKRGKILQGILESQKIVHAQLPQIIEIYDGGVSEGRYFMIMEYFESETLREWLLRSEINMASRSHLCRHITLQIFMLSEFNFFHGDLHPGNILVGKQKLIDPGYWVQGRSPCPDYRIIDFGTSEFSGRAFSIRRHWRIFHETYKHLLHPFDIDLLHPAPRPPTNRLLELFEWYNSFVAAIPWFLATLGHLHPLHYFHGPFHRKRINQDLLMRLLIDKPEFLTDKFMGDDHDWGTFDYGGYQSIFQKIQQRLNLEKRNAEAIKNSIPKR